MPDIPLEETSEVRSVANASGLELVLLTTPTTPSGRMNAIAQATQGFLYLVSVAGTPHFPGVPTLPALEGFVWDTVNMHFIVLLSYIFVHVLCDIFLPSISVRKKSTYACAPPAYTCTCLCLHLRCLLVPRWHTHSWRALTPCALPATTQSLSWTVESDKKKLCRKRN